MRILQAFHSFSLTHGGGTVDYVYKLSKYLARLGHEVSIWTTDSHLDQNYINSLRGVKVVAFKSYLSLSDGFSVTPELAAYAGKNLKNFDIIHMHCFRSFQNVVMGHYAKKYGIPYVIDAHGSMPRNSGKKNLKRLFDMSIGKKIFNSASKYIAETELGVSEYKAFGASDNKIALFPPPFDTEEFESLPPRGKFRRKYGIKEKHIIMFLGRINRIKGIDFLVESFNELCKKRDDVLLVIVGRDEGFKAELEKLINSLGIGKKVLFTGFFYHKEKLEALVDADIVVQTSRYEQGAWAPIEAVLCGTPIIVSDNSGAGEDVKKIDSGYLVRFGDKTDLSSKMQWILDNPEEADIKTKKAKTYIETNLSMKNRIKDYEELLTGCINSEKEHKLTIEYSY